MSALPSNGMVRIEPEVSSAQLAREWRGTVAGWLQRMTADDVIQEIVSDHECALTAAMLTGDPAKVGALVMGVRQALAERLARRWADDWSRS